MRRLYDRHGAPLVAYARGFVPDAAAAEDVVHHVFLRLLTAQLTKPDAPVAYVYRAVRNAALNARRSGSRLTELNPNPKLKRTYCRNGCILPATRKTSGLFGGGVSDGNTDFDLSPAERWGALERPALK